MLEPAYISTVDSGNLAGHLIALRQACLEIRARAPVVDRTWHALDAALAIVAERLNAFAGTLAPESPLLERVRAARAHLLDARSAVSAAGNPGGTASLETIVDPVQRMSAVLAGDAPAVTEWIDWCLRLLRDPAAFDPRRPAGTDIGARLEAIAERAYALCAWRWTSASCSTTAESCSRSDISRARTRSTTRTTICSHPKRAWPASSRWQRETFPSITGSGSGAR